MPHQNLELLEITAERLRPLLPEIVFVGGCATGLLVTDPGAAPVRRTYDVDVIAEIASYAEYTIFSERLRELGFQEDAREGAPLCRWKYQGLLLDVMPLDAKILGFSNRWYADALRTASEVCLPGDLTLRAITAPYFLGTKIEAFRGRGREDYFASHDLEDLITVVDGRPSLLNEVEAASVELRRFIGEAVQALLTEPRFLDALPGYLLPDEANQARIVQLTGRLRVLGRLA
jgi:predicted nucleotidyltransferase